MVRDRSVVYDEPDGICWKEGDGRFRTDNSAIPAHIDVERGLSKATVSAYGADLKKYRQWLADQGVGGIAAVTTQDVERYIVFLDESGESSRSKARRLASIHALHRFAVNEHIVVDDVSAQVKALRA